MACLFHTSHNHLIQMNLNFKVNQSNATVMRSIKPNFSFIVTVEQNPRSFIQKIKFVEANLSHKTH